MRASRLLGLLAALAACGGDSGAEDGLTVRAGSPEAAAVESPAAEQPQPAAAAPQTQTPTTGGSAAAAGIESMTDSTGALKPLLRETYAWSGSGRDPFRALVSIERSGPEFPDLELTGVIYSDSDPSGSVAMFREHGSTRRYAVNPGDMIGRLYVARITQNGATLRMNDFGTVREQTYSLRGSGDENP